MLLTELEKRECGIVKKIHAKTDLKQRLISFGIIKGAQLRLLAVAPKKSTLEIEVHKMKIALRKEEAELIEVERC
ncbi:MAG: ferrous iron transport protein A [Epsilonproteobacteria bacterium]|nr:ferrous iron transport protein A [Campylobacterota bacterium]